MKFIINKRIIFHEDKSTIELLGDIVEPVLLTTTMCRVLSLLVKNNNLLLSRDFLLTNGWDEYGKSSSHSNLNNYISMIRKIFTTYGESEIIITVPRQGFMFSANEVNTIDDGSSLAAFSSICTKNTHVLVREKWKPLSILTFTLIIVAVMMLFIYPFVNKFEPVNHHTIGKVHNCSIEVLTGTHYTNLAVDEIEKVKPLIESAKFNCELPSTIFYFNSDMLVSRVGMKTAISFLSYCPLSVVKGLEPQCENVHETIDKK